MTDETRVLQPFGYEIALTRVYLNGHGVQERAAYLLDRWLVLVHENDHVPVGGPTIEYQPLTDWDRSLDVVRVKVTGKAVLPYEGAPTFRLHGDPATIRW